MKKMQKKHDGFAMLIFVIITSLSLMSLIVSLVKFQELSMIEVRSFVENEKDIRVSFSCIKAVGGVFAKQPKIGLNDDINILFDELRGFKIYVNTEGKGGVVNTEDFENLNNWCEIIEVKKCERDCEYMALIGSVKNKFYVEWTVGEYRVYINKLIFVKNFINSLEFL